MKRFYVFQDEKMTGATGTREEAVDMIRQHQEEEFVRYDEN